MDTASLAAAVLKQALFDAKRGNFSARRFFDGGDDLDFWCACGGLNSSLIRARASAVMSKKSRIRRGFRYAAVCKGR